MDRSLVTGLILAGGAGRRMGGVDKGLQPFQGLPLVEHVLQRLAPQVGPLMISANRNRDQYRRPGVPVVADESPGHEGPLAGFLAGLRHCSTPWLVTAPCDAPYLPEDLVKRLAAAVLQPPAADLAMPLVSDAAGVPRSEPAFCLLRSGLAADLVAFMHAGGRKVEQWAQRQRLRRVPFDRPGDALAFFNANTMDDLTLAGHAGAPRHTG